MYRLLFLIAAAGCATGPYPKSDTDISMKIDRMVHYGNSGSILLKATIANRSPEAQCYHADQFDSGPATASFRVFEGDNLLRPDLTNFDVVQASIGESGEGARMRVGIIPAGETLAFDVPIGSLYRISKNKSYRIEYTFNAAPCAKLLDRYIDIPPPGIMYYFNEAYIIEDLEDLKDLNEDEYQDWFSIGQFIEMTPYQFMYK